VDRAAGTAGYVSVGNHFISASGLRAAPRVCFEEQEFLPRGKSTSLIRVGR
jgi:hypothetical protein